MKKLAFGLLTFIIIFSLSNSAYALSWQTTPIMGYSAANVTGDLVVITGDTPTDSEGNFYFDVDGNLVLGPTIPHYNESEHSLYGIGDPSVSTFVFDPNVWDGSHWIDEEMEIHSGSGINVTAGHSYTYERTYSFCEPGSAYNLTATGGYNAIFDFVMFQSILYSLWLEDAGDWTYTETWTDNDTGESISAYKEFELVNVPGSGLTSVPEPATLALLGPGLLFCGFLSRKKFLK